MYFLKIRLNIALYFNVDNFFIRYNIECCIVDVKAVQD
jgi:hypothetical protein